MVTYPVHVYGENPDDVAANEAAFVKNYDAIFTPYLKNCVLAHDLKEEMTLIKGAYSVGNDGCLWVEAEDKGLRVISIRARNAERRI